MKDSFLHLPPALFKKYIYNGNRTLPLVSVITGSKEKETQLMWAIEDDFAPIPTVILQPFSGAIPFLKRVTVSVEEGGEDWRIIHEHWSVLEETVLDQIRLVRRQTTVQLWTPMRPAAPLSLFIEDFDARNGEYGVIDSCTELIIVPRVRENSAAPAVEELRLQIIPCLGDGFSVSRLASSSASDIYRIGEHVVPIEADESVPAGFIHVPYYLLETILPFKPKQFINCAAAKNTTQPSFSFRLYPEGMAVEGFPLVKDPKSPITLYTGKGTALVYSETEHEDVSYAPFEADEDDSEVDSLASFLMDTTTQTISLIEGKIGAGKTVAIRKAITRLNWSSDFKIPIEYIDLLDGEEMKHEAFNAQLPSLIVLDHFDEFIEADGEEDAAVIRFKSSLKRINRARDQFGHRFVLLVRSGRSLAKYWRSGGAMAIDAVYRIESASTSQPSKQLIMSPSFAESLSGESAEKVIQQLQKYILNPIKYAPLYTANGLKLQTGILISGPSGSGKSFLAKLFLEAHGISFIACRGPEVLDKYVGASEAAIRGLFDQARHKRPCVLFFDEFDSLVPQRGSNHSGVTDRIVNQFLTELDGTSDRSGVFVLACSSRPELIDKAIMRPGRIDHLIELKMPTMKELMRELKKTRLEHKHLIMDYLKRQPKITLSWADFKLLCACGTGEEVAKTLARLESKTVNADDKQSAQTRPVQKLTLA